MFPLRLVAFLGQSRFAPGVRLHGVFQCILIYDLRPFAKQMCDGCLDEQIMLLNVCWDIVFESISRSSIGLNFSYLG